MKNMVAIIGVMFMLGGLVMFFQGLNVIPGSFMTGQIFWAFVGFFCMVIGGGATFLAIRNQQPR